MLPNGPLIVEIAKLTGYLLNSTHPTGKSKAAFFEAFGFRAADPLELARALTSHAVERAVMARRESAFGASYEVRCSIRSPDGRDPCIVSVWFAASNATSVRLVTAYPSAADP